MATVIGLFDNTNQAQAAIEQLHGMDIPRNDISLAMRAPDGATVSSTGEGAVAGAIGGGVLGGIAGLIVGLTTAAVPGVGPVVVGGWLAPTLIGAGIGATAGGIVGALINAGVPEDEARLYEAGLQHGGVLVTAQVPDEQVGPAREVLNTNGARNIRDDSELFKNPNFRYGMTTSSTMAAGDVGAPSHISEAGTWRSNESADMPRARDVDTGNIAGASTPAPQDRQYGTQAPGSAIGSMEQTDQQKRQWQRDHSDSPNSFAGSGESDGDTR